MQARIGLVGALVAVALGCGGRPLEQEIEKHPARVLPRGAAQVLYTRIDLLRGNALASLAVERLNAVQWSQSLQGIADTLGRTGNLVRLVLGTYETSDNQPSAVVVATGRFDPKEFRAAIERDRVPFVEGKHGSLTYFTCGRGDARCYVCFPSPQAVVVASREKLLKETLDLAQGRGRNLTTDRGFAPLLESFSPETEFWATGVLPAAFVGWLGETLQSPAVQMIQGFTVGLKGGGPSKQLTLSLLCQSGEAASANAALLQALIRTFARQAILIGYDIPDLLAALSGLRIKVENREAVFELAMSDAAIASTAKALEQGPSTPTLPLAVPPAGMP